MNSLDGLAAEREGDRSSPPPLIASGETIRFRKEFLTDLDPVRISGISSSWAATRKWKPNCLTSVDTFQDYMDLGENLQARRSVPTMILLPYCHDLTS